MPSSSVSTETPSHVVSNFDHLVTQWMSRVIVSEGSAWSSSQVQLGGDPFSSPPIEKVHSASGVCGVGHAAINLVTTPGQWWFQWPMFGWGIGLLAHGASVYFHAEGGRDRMIEEELERLRQKR